VIYIIMKLDKYLGKKFGTVENALMQELAEAGYSLLINDPSSPASIDKDPHRCTVYVNDEFIIHSIVIG